MSGYSGLDGFRAGFGLKFVKMFRADFGLEHTTLLRHSE